MNSVHRSILLSAADRYGSFVLFIGATAVLSRLLSPVEFGVYAVVNAVTAVIAASFQEFGGGNYLIQKRELSPADVRSAFTITLAISVAIAFLLFVLAGSLSGLFGQEHLKGGIEISALNFLLVPFSGTVSALLRRDMKFGTLTVCNLAAGITVAVVSIGFAMAGFSYMAPILGGLAGNVILTLALLAGHRDLGALRLSLLEYREVVSFGLYSSGISLINVFYNLAPQLLLARILDFASVGLYSRATNLTQVFDRLVTQVLNPVIMPAIIARRQAGEDLKAVYLEAVELLSAAQWPFLIFVVIMARPIIAVWLGQTWLEIVPLVRLLCIANMALFAACLSYPVLVAVGRVRDALVSSFISLPPSLLVVWGASFLGVQAVAAAALLTLPFQAALAIYFIGRQLRLRPRDLAGALTKSGFVTAATAFGVAPCAALTEAGTLTPLTGLALALCAAAACWWLGLLLTGHPLLHQLHQAAAGLARITPKPSRLAL
ncbi:MULTISPECIES: oligosaccharide flippase family protein [unclassified Bradyrhizobium]|uniref:oligosaccharide flippase family protein n=1 Tax=unclassified Bradyrhizobium TaxID=2631580 RepID=UPI001FF92A14|nr:MULTISPECIES: oligosaccharide flippase family protein [unclassified Bradyrhizobium]MCK1535432.1 oligosaccharide flippase family protein [Bradyrhizobium sp. 176]MCK1558109.1 oligosaccharide flippase family protein [Bradyrhizobium sp. 171]